MRKKYMMPGFEEFSVSMEDFLAASKDSDNDDVETKPGNEEGGGVVLPDDIWGA